MKRYSIAPSTHRRKTTIDPDYNHAIERAKEELERLDQEKTLVLQEIDRSLSQANNVINHKIFPVLKKYSQTCDEIKNNSSFWKYFFEQSALIKIESYESQIDDKAGVGKSESVDGAGATYNTPIGDVEADKLHRKRPRQIQRPIVAEDDSIATFESTTTNLKRPNNNRGAIDQSTPQWGGEKLNNNVNNNNINDNSSLLLEPPHLQSTHQVRKTHPPVKTQTIRRSLDSYHKVSISPQKQTTTTPKSSHRFSTKLEAWRNSSPTMPEPPVLESGITPQLNRSSEGRRVVSPTRGSRIFGGATSSTSSSNRLRTATTAQVILTPLQRWRQDKAQAHQQQDDDEEDARIAPPRLLSSRLPPVGAGTAGAGSVLAEESDLSGDMEPPELNTIEFKQQKSGPNEKDNVFLETSGGSSTLFHSVMHSENSTHHTHNKSDHDSDNDQPSGSMFDEILQNMSQASAQANESQSDSTDTSELGSFLKTRLKSLRDD
ncbi:DASH complex subunit ask1 [Scheffersomyces spartinae]|uniref:DASH complex subunit ASK1 n=1 Tax=Scheffersomyces spartinae TaxID=45513 RepID=A0A9P8AHZ5_9ASCO|nr:DASH complex subunit ask1 [Scheffersomyces spartinae]KAG7193318.1 DASH complex subunit ask1 [Scheffersomyces spartinae]